MREITQKAIEMFAQSRFGRFIFVAGGGLVIMEAIANGASELLDAWMAIGLTIVAEVAAINLIALVIYLWGGRLSTFWCEFVQVGIIAIAVLLIALSIIFGAVRAVEKLSANIAVAPAKSHYRDAAWSCDKAACDTAVAERDEALAKIGMHKTHGEWVPLGANTHQPTHWEVSLRCDYGS